MPDNNGWEQWKNHILSSLERIEKTVDEMNKRCIERPEHCLQARSENKNRITALENIIDGAKVEAFEKQLLEVEKNISELKVKTSVYSAISGSVAGTIATLIALWRGRG